jgi:hypothetical protein
MCELASLVVSLPQVIGEFNLTEPALIKFLPEWLSAHQSQLRRYLSPSRERDLENYSEQLSMTKEFFDSLPTRSNLYELYKDGSSGSRVGVLGNFRGLEACM